MPNQTNSAKSTDLMTCSPIFIVGCPRSGTHLLRNMLRSHPNLSFTGESHFIPKFYKAFGNPKSEKEAKKLASAILNLQWLQPWHLSLDPASFANDRSYAQIVRRIFEAWAQKESKPRWGDKTPHYVMEMPVLLELFPGCKFIHIIRDGRDVALSWLAINNGPTNVFTAARRWQYYVSTGQRVGRSLPDETYLEIQYEKLLAQPGGVMENICLFINEPFCEELLKPNPLILDYPERKPIFGQFTPSYNYALKTTIVNKNASKWKSQMSCSDKVVFESVAGDLLKSLGYETTSKTRSISKLEQMFWQVHHAFLWTLNSLNSKDRIKWIKTDWTLRWADCFDRRMGVGLQQHIKTIYKMFKFFVK